MLDYAYWPPGEYEEGEAPLEPSILLTERQAESLAEFMDKFGAIKPRLDDRLRAEDLKITHRLLDIVEKKFKPQ